MITEISRVRHEESITILSEMKYEKAEKFKKAVRDLAHHLKVSYKFVNLEPIVRQDLGSQELE